ncbi:MAG: hypothetical protein JWN86_1141 [Planctomycetota bacterium]|nr:hypothetical protein [Planctomycetota bacterium]
MAISSRAGWAMGLGILGVAALVSVSHGQGDGAVQKTAGKAAAPATKFVPAVVGSIDLEAVFRGYEKSKFHIEQLKAEGMAREGELKGFIAQAKGIAKEMEALQPGSKDFKDRDGKLTQLKANLQAVKESAEREGQAKYAEIMATFYKEVQAMTKIAAERKGISYVVRVSNEPLDSQDPEGVMAAMARPVVFSDPSTDITSWVLWNLNQAYIQSGGPVAKNPAGTATTDEQAKPAAATRPVPRTATGTAAPSGRPATQKLK